MKISVIVPVYNVQKYLSECIESVVGQTYEDWELILVDDGSVDKSGTICDMYEAKYPGQIRTVHQINSGQIISRVEGVKCASGDYCVFLDADDVLNKDALEIIAGTVEKYSPDMLIYNGHYMSESGEKGDLIYPDFSSELTCYEKEKRQPVFAEVIRSRRFNYIWMKAIRKSCIDVDIDYRPYTYIRTEEDLLMQLPYFDRAEKIVYLPQSLYLYRDALGSITKQFRLEMYQSVVHINKSLRFYAEKWDVEEWDKICRHRFLQDVISVIKQMSAAKGKMTKVEQLKYLQMMRNDVYFKENSAGFWRGMSPKQMLVLLLLMCRGYIFLLLLI